MTHPEIQKRVIGVIANFGAASRNHDGHCIQVLSRLCAETKEGEIPVPEELLEEGQVTAASIISRLTEAGYDEVPDQPPNHRAFFGAFQFLHGPALEPTTSVSLVVVQESGGVRDQVSVVEVTEAVYLFNFGFTGDAHDVKRENPLKSQQSGMIDWIRPSEAPSSPDNESPDLSMGKSISPDRREKVGPYAVSVTAPVWDELVGAWQDSDAHGAGGFYVGSDSYFTAIVSSAMCCSVPRLKITKFRRQVAEVPTAVLEIEYRVLRSIGSNKPIENVCRYALVTVSCV